MGLSREKWRLGFKRGGFCEWKEDEKWVCFSVCNGDKCAAAFVVQVGLQKSDLMGVLVRDLFIILMLMETLSAIRLLKVKKNNEQN